jgi:hypothetical protein
MECFPGMVNDQVTTGLIIQKVKNWPAYYFVLPFYKNIKQKFVLFGYYCLALHCK